MTVQDPIKFREPVTISVTVTSERDQDLGVSLETTPNVILEEPINQSDVMAESRGKGWFGLKTIKAKTNTPIVFSFTAQFPDESFYRVRAYASVIGQPIRVVNEITISHAPQGGKAYLAGTPVPYNTGPAPTSITTSTHYPSYTPYPSPTAFPPTKATTPTPTRAGYPPPATNAASAVQQK
jgi:hypothetical protein